MLNKFAKFKNNIYNLSMEISGVNFLKLQAQLMGRIEGFDPVFLNKKYNLTIKDKFLVFLLDGNKTPSKLIELLGVAKTNLALISASLISDGLIQKQKDDVDKRLINYCLTEKGRKKASEIAKILNENLLNTLEYKNKNDEINALVDKLIELLS